MNINPVYSVVACLIFYFLVFIFGFYYFRKENFLKSLTDLMMVVLDSSDFDNNSKYY